MKTNNFTASDVWKCSNKIRYDVKDVLELSNIDFLIRDKYIQCLQFFNVDFTESLLKLLKSTIVNNKDVKFKYIDLSDDDITQIRNWCDKYNVDFVVDDVWDAPKLSLNSSLEDYIKSCCVRIKRDYTAYLNDKTIKYRIFDKDSFEMWTSVLKIDKNSWKGDNKCDMKSLEREDLQYIFYLLNCEKNSSLIVAYIGEKPLAYSLWFKAENDDLWYAAKWGASSEGRKYCAGIKVLFEHINVMNKNNYLHLDFWGRRSRFYDMLKNCDVKRYHFQLRGKNDGENNQ